MLSKSKLSDVCSRVSLTRLWRPELGEEGGVWLLLGQTGGRIDAVKNQASRCLFTRLTSPFVAEVSDAVCHCFNAECEHTGTVCHASMLSV